MPVGLSLLLQVTITNGIISQVCSRMNLVKYKKEKVKANTSSSQQDKIRFVFRLSFVWWTVVERTSFMKASCSQGNDSVVLLSFIWESRGCLFLLFCFLVFGCCGFFLFFHIWGKWKGQVKDACSLNVSHSTEAILKAFSWEMWISKWKHETSPYIRHILQGTMHNFLQ